MSEKYDGRHKYGEPERIGIGVFRRTCRVCGRIYEFEPMIPQAFIDAMLVNLRRPNPYRELTRV